MVCTVSRQTVEFLERRLGDPCSSSGPGQNFPAITWNYRSTLWFPQNTSTISHQHSIWTAGKNSKWFLLYS